VRIPRGRVPDGADVHYPEEAPAHRVSVNGFWMDVHAVTNAEFKRFVEATHHVTLAARPADAADYPGAKPEPLAPRSVVFRKAPGPVDMRNASLHVGGIGCTAGIDTSRPMTVRAYR